MIEYEFERLVLIFICKLTFDLLNELFATDSRQSDRHDPIVCHRVFQGHHVTLRESGWNETTQYNSLVGIRF